MIPASGSNDEFMQIPAPAQPGSRHPGRAQPVLIGEITRERTGHPPADIIEGRRGLREVEHGFLDLGPRRIRAWLRSLDRPRRPVEADPFDRYDPPPHGDGHVNRLRRLVDEPMQLSRCLVTEDCARSR